MQRKTEASVLVGGPVMSALGLGTFTSSRLMGRTLGMMLLAGALIAQLWLLMPHPAGSRTALLEAIILAVVGAGAVLLGGAADFLPRPAFHLLVPVLLTIVAIGHWAAGPGRTGFDFFFLWLAPWLFYFFSARAALVHTAVLGVVAAVLWTLEASTSLSNMWSLGWASRWLLMMGTALVLGLLGRIARQLSSSVLSREHQLRTMIDASLAPSALVDGEGVVTRVNAPFAALLGPSADELIGARASELGLAYEQTGSAGERIGSALLSGEHQLIRNDGSPVYVRAAALPVSFGRTFTGIVLQLEDLTAQKAAEENVVRAELARESELLTRAVRQETLVNFARFALSSDDLDSVLARVVQVAAATLAAPLVAVAEARDEGRELRVIAGQGWEPRLVADTGLVPARNSHSGYAWRHGTTVTSLATESRFEVHRLLKLSGAVDGVACPILTRGGAYGVVNVYTDLPRTFTAEDVATLEMLASIVAAAIDRHETDQEHRRDAMRDPLTGLPNRTLFVDRLDRALDRAARDDNDGNAVGNLAVLLIDVDQFKNVNDSLGHAAGDDLLLDLAPRLRTVVRSVDTVAHLGGDEFAVLLTDLDGPGHVLALVDEIVTAWQEPFTIAGATLHITASVGVSVLGGDRKTAFEVLQEADTAMYRAKGQGRGRVEMFDEQMRAHAVTRLTLESAMRAALDRGEFSVAYQPVIRLADDSVTAVEALARWTHPTRGPVGPDEFIPVAESSGLIVELGAWILGSACTQLARWRRTVPGADELCVNVNASARQLVHPGFVDVVTAVLGRTGLPAQALGLEITESVLIEDGPAAMRVLQQLKDVGVRILLDDFGTGYSSLSYLKAFPVDYLKIDRSFINGLGTDNDDTAIVTAIATMARSLGLAVVGEGVETEQHHRRLADLGCEFGQGYFYARPMPAVELETALRQGQRRGGRILRAGH